MTPSLAQFQDGFAHALFAPPDAADLPAGIAHLAAQPGFAVYRNTVMKGCIDALQANFPAVLRLVGEEWFRAAAAVHVRESPPTLPMLLEYGARFADFLERFPPAAELTYLAGVARLDRLWTEAHAAADADALDPAVLGLHTPEELARLVLTPHPATRWAWFGYAPIHTIWSRNRAGVPPAEDLDWKPEGALLVRPVDAVAWQELDAAGCAFLDACAAGEPLGVAAQAALERRPGVDLAGLLAGLLAAGAFSASHFIADTPHHPDSPEPTETAP